METLGEKIQRLRVERKMTQTQFAESIGYGSQGAISQIEKSIIPIPFKRISMAAQVFGISEEDLVRDTDYQDKWKQFLAGQQDINVPADRVNVGNETKELFAIFPFLSEEDKLKVVEFTKRLYARSVLGE